MKLQLYVLRQLVVAFTFAVAGLMFVALPGIVVSAVHRLPNTDTIVLLRYLPLVLQNLAPYVLPICFLLAVVATYGRLAADNEWTAIQMSGVRPLGLLGTPFALALALGAGTYWMVSTELPLLKKRQKEYRVAAASSAIKNLAPGRTSLELGGFYLDAAFREGDVFLDAYLHKPGTDGEEDYKAFARTATFDVDDEALRVALTDVEPVGPEAGWTGRASKVTITIPFADVVTGRKRDWLSARYRTSAEMRRALADGDLDDGDGPKYVYEIHRRYAVAASFVMFLALGAATGLTLRRGTRLAALAVSVGYALVYYVISMRLGKELGRNEVLPPELGAWAATVMGTIVGGLLLKRGLRR